MPDANTPAKICTNCGEDCSRRPRVKDQTGKYWCKTCHDRLLAQKRAEAPRTAAAVAAAPAAAVSPPSLAADDDTGLPASFWNDAAAQPAAAYCPSCSTRLGADAVLCHSCGYNLKTGKAAKIKGPKTPRQHRRGIGVKLSISPGLVAVVLLALGGLGFFFAIGSEGAAWGFYAFAVALSLAATVSTIACAFIDKDNGWGIVGILSFVIPCIGIALLYYGLFVTERGMIKALMACSLIIAILSVIGLVMAGVDLSELRPG